MNAGIFRCNFDGIDFPDLLILVGGFWTTIEHISLSVVYCLVF